MRNSKRYLKSLVSVLLLLVLVSSQLFAVSLSEKETIRIENALEKSKESLIQQEIAINQLKKELTKQSESYKKLEREKVKSNIVVGVTCFLVGGIVGGVAWGVYTAPWSN